MRIQKTSAIMAMACGSLVLGGCANTASGYRPIVDGYEDDVYHADLADCQALAKTKRYDNGDTKTAALAGAVVGGAVGAIEDDSVEGAIAGILLGGLIGAAGATEETRTERKNIVIRCMGGRGHPVVG
ncbi:hypothetical protein [Parasphingorhabdus cellanae]|uniref:Glycine zipper family protein n=1 Tax=Parasphingorhabdus cellanae TaxID=2806553 RepID=A0ABX7T4A1_9SPHN|nr:hypothetical protein [Parasphingorhabdus cellanae]QTD55743.1 hypothetical protein J4G78_16365 [Parasphingorhabdus cellanae]